MIPSKPISGPTLRHLSTETVDQIVLDLPLLDHRNFAYASKRCYAISEKVLSKQVPALRSLQRINQFVYEAKKYGKRTEKEIESGLALLSRPREERTSMKAGREAIQAALLTKEMFLGGLKCPYGNSYFLRGTVSVRWLLLADDACLLACLRWIPLENMSHLEGWSLMSMSGLVNYAVYQEDSRLLQALSQEEKAVGRPLEITDDHFFSASKHGELKILKELIEYATSTQTLTRERLDKSLYLAAASGELGVVELLLKHGADPNASYQLMPFTFNPIVYSALERAWHKGDFRVVGCLLQAGAQAQWLKNWEIALFRGVYLMRRLQDQGIALLRCSVRGAVKLIQFFYHGFLTLLQSVKRAFQPARPQFLC